MNFNKLIKELQSQKVKVKKMRAYRQHLWSDNAGILLRHFCLNKNTVLDLSSPNAIKLLVRVMADYRLVHLS